MPKPVNPRASKTAAAKAGAAKPSQPTKNTSSNGAKKRVTRTQSKLAWSLCYVRRLARP